jgi:tetratricopeptide (TPR) repeat protein
MGDHYFISYSRRDGNDFARTLTEHLEGGDPAFAVWRDVRDIQPTRMHWDSQIVDAIRNCIGLLFIMTGASVRDESFCKEEWTTALSYKRVVIPIQAQSGIELPFGLKRHHLIDFSADFQAGLSKLRQYEVWRRTPAGVLQELKVRWSEAEYALKYADPADRARIEEEMDDLSRQIEEQRRLAETPDQVFEATIARIEQDLKSEREAARAKPAARERTSDALPLLPLSGEFHDRRAQARAIGEFLNNDDLRLMSVVGRGGIGKTALVGHAVSSSEDTMPDDEQPRWTDGLVYLGGAGAPALNFPNLFAELCRLLPSEVERSLDERYREPHATPALLTRAALECFGDRLVLVLLDNFEDIVEPSGNALIDADLHEALRTVLLSPAHRVKVIITTRVAPQKLLATQPGLQDRLDLDTGLESPDAENLLRAQDPTGRLGLKNAPDALLGQAAVVARGFPRALEAIAGILAADRTTSLSELLAEANPLPDQITEALVGEAFDRLDGDAQRVMQAVAVYGFPVAAVAVDYLLHAFDPGINSDPILRRLANMGLMRREEGRHYLHQVDRDYVLARVAPGEPADQHADPVPFTQHALYGRAADYYRRVRGPAEGWTSLEDLSPQLAEIELREKAGQYDLAAKVLLEIDRMYLSPWGHSRLVLELHERLQGRITDALIDAASKMTVGTCLLRMGRLEAANQANEQALAAYRKTAAREGVAAALINVAHGHRALGNVRSAMTLYREAVDICHALGATDNEVAALGSLGVSAAELGETREAIAVYERVLDMVRGVGKREYEAVALLNLAEAYGDLEDWDAAVPRGEAGVRTADELGFVQGQAEGRIILAELYLCKGEGEAAVSAAAEACSYEDGLDAGKGLLVLGAALLKAGRDDDALQAFRRARQRSERWLEQTDATADTLDTKALALCGLAVLGHGEVLGEARAAFAAARERNRAPGIVGRVMRLLDLIAAHDPDGILAPLRSIS